MPRCSPGLVLAAIGVAIGMPAYRALTPPGTLSARRGLPAATLIRGVLTFAFFSVDAYVPLLLIGWRGIDASTAGIALTVATLTWTGAAWVQARYVVRLGAGRFVTAGFSVVLVAIGILALVLSPAVPIIVASIAWGIAGIGMGLGYAPLTLIVLAEAPPDGQGMATAALQLSDVLGTALGTGTGGAAIAFAAGAGQPAWVGLAGAFAVGRRGRIPRPRPDRAAAQRERAHSHGAGGAVDCNRRSRTRCEVASNLIGGPSRYVRRGTPRQDSRDPRLPQARHPVLRHHHAAQGSRSPTRNRST